MKNAIDLPIIFDDGQSRNVAISPDSENKLHYTLSVGAAPAGSFTFAPDMHSWTFSGELSKGEQAQIAGFIQNYTDQDWDN